jgi:site-specific DNA-methyltransferase (adenine-specific)
MGIENIKIFNIDCIEGLKNIEDNSIECIITDPPYLYLNHELDINFDEQEYFNQVKRILKPEGFITLFGRGTSFYRWNTILSNIGFKFKEEIIWEKQNISSPLNNLGRVHETISIHTKKNGVIKKSRIHYIEMKKNETLDYKIIDDIKRITTAINNERDLKELKEYVETKIQSYNKVRTTKHNITARTGLKTDNKAVTTLKNITEGLKERSIIKIQTEHYEYIHPTQKPVRLLERLINLVTNRNDTIIDTFSGSGSTAIASINTNRNFIGFEINKQFYEDSIKRIKNHYIQLDLTDENYYVQTN